MIKPSRKKLKTVRNQAQPSNRWRPLRSGALLPSLVSSLLLLAAFPPLNWSWLAWIAPIGWLWVVQSKEAVGKRGYWALWISGCLFWLVSLHSVRLAFWPLYAGWIAMSLYLALYIPALVASTRVMLHRWNIPLVLSAPIAWTGFEMFRSYFLTGYAANTLAHSQAFFPIVVQIADQLGACGLSFLIVMFSAALLKTAQRFHDFRFSHAMVPASTAVLVLGIVLGYGRWRLNQADELSGQRQPLLRVLLLQENTPSVFEMSPDMREYMQRTRSYWEKYLDLCREAVREKGSVDLVVWPESTFTAGNPFLEWNLQEDGLSPRLEEEMRVHGISVDELIDSVGESNSYFESRARRAIQAARGERDSHAEGANRDQDQELQRATDSQVGESDRQKSMAPMLLVGCDHVQYTSENILRYNAGLLIGHDGRVKDSYGKIHLVMFGEYIPLKPLLGWLGSLFSFADAQPGKEPKSFEINGAFVSPNICFESMVPWFIRWQVKELANEGCSPQVLINLTNDSWFRGTVMLDHHLASSILCSVENRRPMLVAANTGISAEIDGSGRILQKAERFTARALLAEPRADGRVGMVQQVGYPLSWICLAIACLALLSPVVSVMAPRGRIPRQG